MASLIAEKKAVPVDEGAAREVLADSAKANDDAETGSPDDAETEEVAVAQATGNLAEAVRPEYDHADEAADVVQRKALEAVVGPEQAVEDAAKIDMVEVLEEKPAALDAVNFYPKENALEVTDALRREGKAPDRFVPETDAIEPHAASKKTPTADEILAEPEAAPVDNDATCGKSGDDKQNRAVGGLLPRLGTSIITGAAIEPIVLSSDSNEMLEVHLPPQQWTYEVFGFSIEKRVVLYHVHKTDRRTNIRAPPILKRYTDFYNLQVNLLDTCLRVAADLPRIPRPHLGTLLRGYKSKKTIEIREKALHAQLQYISQYPALHSNAIFERFIATSRTSSGAWVSTAP